MSLQFACKFLLLNIEINCPSTYVKSGPVYSCNLTFGDWRKYTDPRSFPASQPSSEGSFQYSETLSGANEVGSNRRMPRT